jgi:hypothetical protein
LTPRFCEKTTVKWFQKEISEDKEAMLCVTHKLTEVKSNGNVFSPTRHARAFRPRVISGQRNSVNAAFVGLEQPCGRASACSHRVGEDEQF